MAALLISGKHHVKSNFTHTIFNRFDSDSGYILKKEGIDLLLKSSIKGSDTTDLVVEDVKSTDTIGKYYKMRNGNYMACVLNIIHPDRNYWPIVLEMKPDATILADEEFSDGMYLCCWGNYYEGFNKHGDYFSVKACGTGSGFCSGEIYLFKDLQTLSSGSIAKSAWSSLCREGHNNQPLSCRLTSTMDIKRDTVIMHYQLQTIKSKRRRNKVKKTEFFDVKYIERNSAWMALDSTKLIDLPM